MNNFNRNLYMSGILFLSLFSFIFSNCPDGTDVCVSLGGSSLDIDTSSDIGGFQFNHDGCASGASGGDLSNGAGFTVSASGTTVLAFSFSGGLIPEGSSGVHMCWRALRLQQPHSRQINQRVISQRYRYIS